jgi:arsenite-transporting ATPase
MQTQFVFFSGKGGVGKTTMACTSAVRYADEGQRTLIVTTDPASNLADVFEQEIGHQVTPIAGVPSLWAMEIDPDKATDEYKDRALAPIRDLFPPEIVNVMAEQMNSPCTAEVAAFDRFTDFLDAPNFNIVIFDTAPTGHTLRLLELPAEWSHMIETASSANAQTCMGPAAAIQDAKAKYDRALGVMRDASQTTFVFVLHPEATPIKETHRATAELAKLGIHTHEIIINGILPPAEATNPFFTERVKMQQGYLKQIESEFPLPTRCMYLLDGEIHGAAGLRHVARMLFDHGNGSETSLQSSVSMGKEGAVPVPPRVSAPGQWSSSDILLRILPNDKTRTLFFAGKGGVGKTSVSCVTAHWLARRGHRTLLLTTDPAAHLGDVLGVPVGDVPTPVDGAPNLWAVKIDAKAAAETYKARILEDARARGRPSQAIAAMAEELDSPCTEEMAAFDRFIDFASQDEYEAIVFDTAPTGHTLRLLELPIDWSKQLDVKIFASVDTAAADDVAKARFGRVIDMMRDPQRSTFAFVMYPESTPIVEAERAMKELATVGIPTGLIVANLMLPKEECTTAYTRARLAMQEKYLAEMDARFRLPILQVPLLPHEVRALEVLTELGERIYGNGHAVANTTDRARAVVG